MDHYLVHQLITSVYEDSQADIQHFHRNPIHAYLQVVSILTHILAVPEVHHHYPSLEVPALRSIRKLLLQDAILRYGRQAIRFGILDTKNRPPPPRRSIRQDPLTEALLDETSSVSSDLSLIHI